MSRRKHKNTVKEKGHLKKKKKLRRLRGAANKCITEGVLFLYFTLSDKPNIS